MAVENSIDYSTKHVIVFEVTSVWAKAIKLWLLHYGCKNIHIFDNIEEMKEHVETNIDKIDLCIIDFYNGKENTVNLIKEFRKKSPELLIIAISADFISDKEVLNTKEMIKAIDAGANRATTKNIKHLKEIINEHFCVRQMLDREQIEKGDTKTTTLYK